MRPWAAEYLDGMDNIFDTCHDRMNAWPGEYADKDVLASRENLMKRDVIQEIIEEQYDTINYAVMLILQLEQTRERMRGLE